MAILNIFSSIFANTATENYSHLTKGLCSNYLEGGGGCKSNGGDLKLNYGFGWLGGGARCQFVKHRRGLQAILMFKWYIIYSSSTSSLLNDF